MSFNFSQTSGNSGITTISLSATSTTDVEAKVENYTLSNDSGSSVLMQVIQKAYEPVEKYINLKPSSIEWNGSGGTSSLQIQSNDNWVITSNSWIELSRFEEADRGLSHNTISGNGNTIIGIRAKENTGTTRTGGITGHCISNSAISATTTVVQNTYIKPYIQLSYYSINCDSTGTTSSFTITSNVDWYIVVDESWASVNTESGSGNANITFTVNENTSSIARSCDITVYARDYGIKVSLAINQDATQLKPYITLSPDSFVVSDKGSTGNTISISANCSYDITTETDWITLHSSSGSGDGTVTFDTDPASLVKYNNGLIEFSNSALSRTVTVERQGEEPYLSANTSSLSFVYDSAGTAEVLVYSNVEWDTIVDMGEGEIFKPWFSISPTSGSGNGSIRVSVPSASTTNSGNILLINKEYGLNWSIKIYQVYGNNVIVYTTTDQQIIDVTNKGIGGEGEGESEVISNTYENGVGIIKYNKTVTHLGNSSYSPGGFDRETRLTSIVIPETVTYLGYECFRDCNNLKELTIPSGVTAIESYAFSGHGITKMYWNATQYPTYYPGIPFGVAYELKEVVCAEGVTSLPQYFLRDAVGLEKLILPSTLEVVPFYCCSAAGLTELYCYVKTAPNIQQGAFTNCPSLGTVHYPAGSDYSSWQNYRYLSNWNFIGDL